MAIAKGEMTSLPTSQTIFLQTVEEPKENRINFRDSLKFFQEQLVINGANFPTPSAVSRSGNDTLRKNAHHSYKEQNSDINGKISTDSDAFESDTQSIRSCKIAIPTVDTILESVRVLRAIQKSQEKRGSSWNLDVSSKSDIDFSYTDDWIQVADINQINKESNNERNDEAPSTNSKNTQAVTDINQNKCSGTESSNERNDEIYLNNSEDKQIVADMNQNKHSDIEPNNERNGETYLTNSEDKQTVTDINQIGYSDKELMKERNDETSLTYSEDMQTVTDINQNGYSDKEPIKERNDETPSIDSVNKQVRETKVETQANGIQQESITQSHNDLQFYTANSNSFNEKCSFWPSNSLQNGNQRIEEKKINLFFSAREESKSDKSEILNGVNIRKELDDTDSLQFNENSFDVKSSEKENLMEQIQQNDVSNNRILQDTNASEKSNHFQNSHEDITKNTKLNDTPDSLREVCTDLFNRLNEKISKTEEKSKKLLIRGSETTTKVLKIETYEDIDAQKHDFLLNESLWKESCSPNDSTSTKLEHNDSDSGIGTQRSASSLSPNNPIQMQKDTWSDTCSSHYASAECSPYQSLNSVFESSLGLNSTKAETKEVENLEISTRLTGSEWEKTLEKPHENIKESSEEDHASVPQQTDCDTEKEHISDKYLTNSPIQLSELKSDSENAELDTEISYCNFITNYTIENPCKRVEGNLEEAQPASAICDDNEKEPKTVNGESSTHEQTFDTEKTESLIPLDPLKKDAVEDDSCDLGRIQKFTAASCDLISIVESLYTIKENPAYQVLPVGDAPEEKFEETLFVLSKAAFCEHPEDNYLVIIEDFILYISQNSQVLLSLNMKYGEISVEKNILKIDNRMGRCVYVSCDFSNVLPLKAKIELHCLKHWQTDCLQLVHYPLKCHQNVVIIDIGSCSTRAGILMDQPTLPSLFFPTICATDKKTGTCVYGMEALQPEVRQHSNLSFPVRPTIKITKHTIDIELMEGLFKKIFQDLNVDPTQYTVQVCLPRNLSINAQTALVKLLLEGLKAKAVSLTNQALLTLYAHDVSTAVVVDIGDRTDVLPVVDGFIVENGVTKLPNGGQRLIHHMKHGLAEKRISLSNDIDSFVVQYIIENLAYIAEDYDNEIRISSQHPDLVTKTVTLQPASSEGLHCKSITLEEARFKIPEGLFNPDLWGLDSPGIHHLVQKAIQATSVDARKRIAENIYVSGGVTMLPGFVERLNKEVTKLSKAKIVPKVYASNYRYHCTYIGACKFAKMEVFPQVCISLQDYTENSTAALKKCALYF